MTKKDYVLIVGILKDAAIRSVFPETGYLDAAQRVLINNLVEGFSYKLKQDNPRFDPERFKAAVYAYEAEIRWTPAELKEVA